MFSENGELTDEMYRRWRDNPESVDATWRAFFAGMQFAGKLDDVPLADAPHRPTCASKPALCDSSSGTGRPGISRHKSIRSPRPRRRQTRCSRSNGSGSPKPTSTRPLTGRCTSASTARSGSATCFDALQGDLLPDHRRRVHAHRLARHAVVARRADRADPQSSPVRTAAEVPHAHHAAPGRAVREVPAHEVRRPEAVLARRRRDADSDPRRDRREGAVARRQGVRHRHGPPRPAERAREHAQQAVRGDLHRVRGQLPAAVDARRRRRREVPPRLLGRRGNDRRASRSPLARAEPEPPGDRRSRGRGPRAGQAAAPQRHRAHDAACRF